MVQPQPIHRFTPQNINRLSCAFTSSNLHLHRSLYDVTDDHGDHLVRVIGDQCYQWHTHTHTHIYIYIYICILQPWQTRNTSLQVDQRALCTVINFSCDVQRWGYRVLEVGLDSRHSWPRTYRTIGQNININICSIELKWDSKKLKCDMMTRWDEYV